MSLYKKDVSLNAASKNQSYLTRRTRRDRYLEAQALKLCMDQKGHFTMEEFYEHYGKGGEGKKFSVDKKVQAYFMVIL